MRVLLVNDNEPSTNIGCRETAHGFRKIISEKGHDIENQIYIDELRKGISGELIDRKDRIKNASSRIDVGVPTIDQIKPKSVYRSMGKLLSGTPTNAREIKKIGDEYGVKILPEDHKSSLEKSDLVLVNGEGAFYKNRTHARLMLYYAYVATKLDSTKTVVSNLTLSFDDIFISPELRSMATFVLPLVDEVIFREPYSYSEYTNKTSETNCTLGADVAFANRSKNLQSLPQEELFSFLDFWNDKQPSIKSTEEYVCMGGNSIYTVSDTAKAPASQYGELIDEIKESYSVILVPSKEADEKYLREVAERNSVPMVSSKNSLGLLRGLLSNASAYVGGRYHPAVFALSERTPIICFSTKQNKNKGLLEHAGFDINVYDAYNFQEHKEQIKGNLDKLTAEFPNRKFDEQVNKLERLARKNCPKT